MKKAMGFVLCAIALVLCISFVAPAVDETAHVAAVTVETVTGNANEARFLNMLNHNFVYNADFENADTIVNNSTLALLELRDSENSDYISSTYVKSFVKDMYGIELEDMAGLNAEYPQLEGFVYVIPRGFTSYNHSIVSVDENEDGSFTVVSEVTISDHDNGNQKQKAVSLFVPNDESAFGYNMIYCDILVNSLEI